MYDPISDASMPTTFKRPDSFWAAANTEQTQLFLPQSADIETDVAIIGGGFTGLSTALHLRKDFGVSCTVIEANQPAWGASGRNGGFVLPGTGRLGVKQLEQKWGKQSAQAIYHDYLESVDNVKALVDTTGNSSQRIACDYSQGGYLKLAHKPELVEGLHAQANLLSSDFGDAIVALNSKQIKAQYLQGATAYGGIYYPNAFSVNPWKLCQGIAQSAHQHGAQILGNTAVLSTEYKHAEHHIHTNNGVIKAKRLVLASNAYGLRKLHSAIKDRMFPVMSSILVTKPLTDQQLALIGMHKGLMVMDTRTLKYYYRLLPDKRLLFGGRGPITGKEANKTHSKTQLLAGLRATFQQLEGLEIDHFWSGWVSVSLDDYPRIYNDKNHNVFYSGGYCGAGLAFSIQAGKRLAQLMCAPHELPKLPYWKTPLKPFPVAGLRRSALRAFYAFEAIKSNFRKPKTK